MNPTCGYQQFFKTSFYDVIYKKKYFLCGKRKTRQTENAEHKQNREVSFLKQGSKMNGFCLKQGQGLKASAVHLHPYGACITLLYSRYGLSKRWKFESCFNSNLFLIFGCITFNFTFLSFSTLRFSSLWRIDTILWLFEKAVLHPGTTSPSSRNLASVGENSKLLPTTFTR